MIVESPNGQQAKIAEGFSYVAAAAVLSSVTPNTGPLSGGNTVTISGANFVGNPEFESTGLIRELHFRLYIIQVRAR